MPLLRDIKNQLGSSYLLEHADNPVLWRTWGEDALEEAARTERPIFLSVGYAACHWCHVMAHESFESDEIAALLNKYFVPIKVDREERPDVDALYMAATQIVSGHGGWPMSVFLLPDGRPFMAGTYYPPHDRGGQVGFDRLLLALHDAWTTQRESVESQAAELSRALSREVSFVDHLAPLTESLDLATVRTTLRRELMERSDDEGGFGGAPKFPRPSFVEALLEFDDDASRRAVEITLDAMSRRGLYDHFGGGFARYSVDDEWHVPHFEKMLSDQALLARCYFDAARVSGRKDWRDVALDTLNFVVRHLRVHNGYAASLDADAGGVEGSHITWSPEEVATFLTNERAEILDRVLARWRIESPGTFEGRSIPRLAEGESFTTPDALVEAHSTLIHHRGERVQPSRDHKVILEWNAMLASAFFRSNDDVFQSRGYELLSELSASHFADGVWWRTAHRRAQATASDVAWFIDAHVDAFEASGDGRWLDAARGLSDFLLAHFWDGPVPTSSSPNVGYGIFSQSDSVLDLVTRPKEIFDGATPSAHAVATRSLARLALCCGDNELLTVARRLVDVAGSLLLSHPVAVPDLVQAAGFAFQGIEVVIPGDRSDLAHHLRSKSMPRTVLITGAGSSPLLRGRHEGLAYVCRGGVCGVPVDNVSALDAQLRENLTAWPS
jgi:uncharacterized protein YyaL (SSP411 family)